MRSITMKTRVAADGRAALVGKLRSSYSLTTVSWVQLGWSRLTRLARGIFAIATRDWKLKDPIERGEADEGTLDLQSLTGRGSWIGVEQLRCDMERMKDGNEATGQAEVGRVRPLVGSK